MTAALVSAVSLDSEAEGTSRQVPRYAKDTQPAIEGPREAAFQEEVPQALQWGGKPYPNEMFKPVVILQVRGVLRPAEPQAPLRA